MSSTRRTLTVLAATLVAVLTGATPAFAQPAPLIEPAPGTGSGSTSATGGSLDGWVEVGLALVVAAAVVVVVAAIVSRTRNRVPTTA